MSSRETYPKRLIEVDLPIKRISAHARREKSIRHGHISTLHIWWARRPLAACRAVICAALWPNPADSKCPHAFIKRAREQMLAWTPHDRQKLLSDESRKRFEEARKRPKLFDDAEELRGALLDFIADFANWDNSTIREYLDTSRALTQAAHEALGGAPGTRPLVVDSFAGGGSIPLEALRVGADAFASDLNPVAVLLNKVVLEYVPKYRQRLADEVRKWGERVNQDAERELARYYPNDPDGATPIAYLWARTVRCEGPNCGATIPLLRSRWLAKKGSRSVAVRLLPKTETKEIALAYVQGGTDYGISGGTIQRGSATCPVCGFTTRVEAVRAQLRDRHGGTSDAKMYAKVVRTKFGGTEFRTPGNADLDRARDAGAAVDVLRRRLVGFSALPIPPDGALGFRVQKYGMSRWTDLFTPRQQLMLLTYAGVIERLPLKEIGDQGLERAVLDLLSLTISKMASFSSSLCVWRNVRTCVAQTFGRQTLSMVWDFGEMNPFAESAGDFGEGLDYLGKFISHVADGATAPGRAEYADAVATPLPDDLADLFFTDPPYYDAIPYGHLSQFFITWLNATGVLRVGESDILSQREQECIVDEGLGKKRDFFERKMSAALAEGRRVAKPNALGIVVFAHKSTAGWETQLQAMVDAGWVTTASWPIDTERSGRLRAHESAALASSVHLVCRPRENPDGSARTDEIGDWRDVLQELPRRIHAWMPRLAEEGVVGADAIFACLGPALEIFSRYSRVEKASGETVSLKEYLEQVWAAVAKEALAMIFTGADATGFEADARLTAMWLWTLSTSGSNGKGNGSGEMEDDEPEAAEDGTAAIKDQAGGFVLEYDAARKIAQGLGAHLEQLTSLIEVKGATARLLPVAERTRSLFQKGGTAALTARGKAKKKSKQLSLGFVADLEEAEEIGGWGETRAPQTGETVLDRVHQSMILFGAGRGEALKRFLVDDGVGRDYRFWRLAQAFSALYPTSTDEKRWVDGVLARKKGLGF